MPPKILPLLVKEELDKIIYEYRKPVLKALRALSFSFALASLALLFYYYGFPSTPERKEFLVEMVKFIFLFFIFNYFVKLLFTFSKIGYIKEHWVETLIILLLIYDGISYFLFGVPLLENFFIGMGIENYFPFYVLLIQLFLLIFVGMEVSQVGTFFQRFNVPPHTLLLIAYLVLISLGTMLLMMPNMTTAPGGAPFIDALFTSTSASCVTGLIVVDTSTYYSFTGQVVILLLMQLGGIGILVFGMVFIMLSGQGMGIGNQSALQRFFDASSLYTAKSLVKQVIIFTLIIESIAAIGIYTFIGNNIPFESQGEKIFFSVFHAVSAFCNAGFSTLTGGLENEHVNQLYILHLFMAAIIFLGSMGFHAMKDITSINLLRQRMKNPWRKWEINTRIAIYSAIALSIFGALIYLLFEWDDYISEKPPFGIIANALFQSISARTAGFSTVDIGSLDVPVILSIIFLMFVGGSSVSTAGGIRTSTFVMVFLSGFATIRGKKNVEIGHRQISTDTLNRAFSIFLFAVSYIFGMVFLVSIIEPDMDILPVVFEVVSAFCTTGLSMGITGDMSEPGKILLVVSMISGRLGILTLAYILSTRVKSKAYSYPKAHIMVG